MSGNQFNLSRQTDAGQNYQIEYKDNFAAPNWTLLGSSIPGTGGLVTTSNNLALSTQRFFRISAQ